MRYKQYFTKKILFFFLRMVSKIVLFEGKQRVSGIPISLCYVGCLRRGSYFVRNLYGYPAEGKTIGRCFPSLQGTLLSERFPKSDIIMIEVNRLLSEKYFRAGYFPIPEWVEFGRMVVREAALRYAGASKSLRSDLNRIIRSDYQASVTKREDDFELFYKQMYLPYVSKRYASDCIIKPRRHLRKSFESGFILFLSLSGVPFAGALILVDNDRVTEAAIGVHEGSEEIFRAGVSGMIDYHIHQWAAENNKTFLDLGHTRPFPLDGVYFNKRKWMMSLRPDDDGVMSVAVKFNGSAWKVASLINASPFIFQVKNRLNLLWAFDGEGPLSGKLIDSFCRRFMSDGIDNFFIVSPNGCDRAVTANTSGKGKSGVIVEKSLHEIANKFGESGEIRGA